MNINGEKKKQLMNINGEKKKQLMNINGEKNVQREKCSAPMASNRRRNLLSLKRGRQAGFFSIKFLLFFVCRKGRNKICYIRHIFSVFLKFTPKFGRDLLRSLDGIYSEVWTGFTPKFGRNGEGLTQNLLKFSAHESHEWREQCLKH